MRILVTPSCERSIKKLHPNQKKSLDKAIKAIASKPEIGEAKVGDLEGIYVYKFKLVDKQWLLGYRVILASGKLSRWHVANVVPEQTFYRRKSH